MLSLKLIFFTFLLFIARKQKLQQTALNINERGQRAKMFKQGQLKQLGANYHRRAYNGKHKVKNQYLIVYLLNITSQQESSFYTKLSSQSDHIKHQYKISNLSEKGKNKEYLTKQMKQQKNEQSIAQK